MPKSRKQRRIWIEDFRVKDTPENRVIARLMADWKVQRKRPFHFVRALWLYKALLDGDIDLFLDILIDVAPRAAVRLMQRFGSTAPAGGDVALNPTSLNGNGRKLVGMAVQPVEVEYAEQSADEKINNLAESLGLDEMEF